MKLYGIQPLELNGGMTFRQRAEVVRQFHESKVACVMVVSNVAQVGLNLQCANILVSIVSSRTGGFEL